MIASQDIRVNSQMFFPVSKKEGIWMPMIDQIFSLNLTYSRAPHGTRMYCTRDMLFLEKRVYLNLYRFIKPTYNLEVGRGSGRDG